MEIKIGVNMGYFNEDRTELTVHMGSDGWDSRKRWREDLEHAAQNSNDTINEDVCEALEPLGLTLSDEDHKFDEDEECIIYKVVQV